METPQKGFIFEETETLKSFLYFTKTQLLSLSSKKILPQKNLYISGN